MLCSGLSFLELVWYLYFCNIIWYYGKILESIKEHIYLNLNVILHSFVLRNVLATDVNIIWTLPILGITIDIQIRFFQIISKSSFYMYCKFRITRSKCKYLRDNQSISKSVKENQIVAIYLHHERSTVLIPPKFYG